MLLVQLMTGGAMDAYDVAVDENANENGNKKQVKEKVDKIDGKPYNKMKEKLQK